MASELLGRWRRVGGLFKNYPSLVEVDHVGPDAVDYTVVSTDRRYAIDRVSLLNEIAKGHWVRDVDPELQVSHGL